MSALGDYLRLLQLNCRVYHNQQVCGDWMLQEHEIGQTCFHLVTHGTCRLSVGSHEVVLETGDLVLFPREIRHRLVALSRDGNPPQTRPLTEDWAPNSTGLLCASVRFEHRVSEKLLDTWPDYLLVPHDSGTSKWLEPILKQLVAVSRTGGAGSEVVVDRLAEIVFLQSVRHHARNAAQGDAGFLKVYVHPTLGHALERFHESPDRQWPLKEAANASHMSRASFARAFKSASGWTWGEYKTWWRMQLAFKALAEGRPVFSVAQSIGYQSEAAFSRVFHTHFGQYAGEVRRAGRTS